MKKVFIRYVLVVCIVLMNFSSFAVFANSNQISDVFSDVADNAPYAEAVKNLNELGIIGGYGDGCFKPDNTITRAETAKLVCSVLGVADEAERIKTSAFSDVSPDSWACGYIAKASQLGIINGYGNGKFGPSDPVTYQQIVKMLVCAWGYGDSTEENGGWPDGYIKTAENKGIISQSVEKNSAVRGNVALLIFNTMNIPSGYESGGNIDI